jgi:hypothetical protein
VVISVVGEECPWEAENAWWIEERVSEERYLELEAGAKPTDEEMAWYQEEAKERESDGRYSPVTNIYRVAAPEGSEEKRVVFLGWVGTESLYGMGCIELDTWDTAGLLRNAAEVREYLRGATVGKFWYSMIPFPEEEDLDVWLQARNGMRINVRE